MRSKTFHTVDFLAMMTKMAMPAADGPNNVTFGHVVTAWVLNKSVAGVDGQDADLARGRLETQLPQHLRVSRPTPDEDFQVWLNDQLSRLGETVTLQLL